MGRRLKIFQKADLHPSDRPGPMARHFGILSIGVDPKLHRKGIGKLLMEAAEEKALKRGHREMRLTVNINNLAAISFYEKLGWDKCFSEDGSFHGTMRKLLLVDSNG